MIGLKEIPTVSDLTRAYEQMGLKNRESHLVSEVNLALWSQWSRLDPRLAEILVKYLADNWRSISPGRINESLALHPWPAAFGLLSEQSGTFLVHSKSEKIAFQHWLKCCMSGLRKGNDDLFFIGLRKLGGKEIHQDASLSFEIYRRWGFLGREILVNKADVEGKTMISSQTRRAALDFLLAAKKRIRIEDYRHLLQNFVSRRQAQLDLKNHPRLRVEGQTRGRTYRKF